MREKLASAIAVLLILTSIVIVNVPDVSAGSDDLAPTLTISSPADGAYLRINSSIVRWAASDASGIAGFTIGLDGGSWTMLLKSARTYTFSNLSEGSHTVTVNATDNEGNTAIVSHNFTVDTIAPLLTITSPAKGASLGTTSPEISWAANDSSGISGYSIRIDGGSWTTLSSSINSYSFGVLSEGSHTVNVNATDNAGNVKRASVYFKIDLAAPSLSITSPTDGVSLSTASPVIRWTASDPSGITGFEISLDDVVWTTLNSSARSFIFTNLSQGPHIVTVNASDAVGNKGSTSATFIVDTIVPTLIITAPAKGASLDATTTSVSWTSSDDGSSIASYSIRLDGGSWTTLSSSITSFVFEGLSEGIHTVSLNATDHAGNTKRTSTSFKVDLNAPSLAIASPIDGTYLRTDSPTIRWTASDPSGISGFEISLDGSTWMTLASSVRSYGLSNLSQGSHTVTVVANDNAGNSASVTVSFTVDTIDPSLTVASPAKGSYIDNDLPFVEWTASDSSGIAGFTLSIDGGEWMTLTSDVNGYAFYGLSQGSHTVHINATDNAGNVQRASVWFKVDTSAPALTITSPADGAYQRIASPIVRWTASDSSGIAGFTLSIDGGEWAALNSSVRSYSFSNLSQGSHTVMMIATDNAGNVQSSSTTFTVDTIAPSLTITSPARGAYLNNAAPMVEWAASDSSGIASYSIRIDGGSWTTLSSDVTSLSLLGLGQGSHTVNVNATDNAGNVKRASVSFRVDPTISSLDIISPAEGEVINTTTPSVTIEWTGYDQSSIASYSIQLDDGQWIALDPSVNSYAFYGLAQGYHTALVKAVNSTGGIMSAEVNFIIETHYDPSLPIHIDSDADLSAQAIAFGWPGDGSAASPYVISGRSSYNTYVGNTTYWLDLVGCDLHGATKIVNATHILIANNTIWDGLYLTSSSNNEVLGNNITGWNSISLSSSDHNTLSNNRLSVINGIDLGTSNYNTISNNTILGLDIEGSAAGMRLGSSSNNTITGNMIWGFGAGISIGDSSDYNLISENQIIKIRNFAMTLDWSHHNVVMNNSINATSAVGVYLYCSSYNVVIGNNFQCGQVNGAYLYSSDNNDILNNTINSPGEIGIYLASSSDNVISNNSIHTPGGQNILEDSMSANDIAGNVDDQTVDATAPAVTIITPFEGGYINTTSPSVHITWTGYDWSGIAGYSVRLDGGSWTSIPYSFWGVSSYAYFGLSQGVHTVTVSATDLAGNTGYREVSFIINTNYDPSLPIHVDSDADLVAQAAAFGWAGDGSAASPYVISGLNYTNPGMGYTELIYIGNTTHHVVIRDCNVNGGIGLYNTSNVVIDNNTIWGWGGLHITSSSDVTVSGNRVDVDLMWAVIITSSNHIAVLDNSITSTMENIRLDTSNNIAVSGNTLNSPWSGIGLYSSNDNNVSGNAIYGSSYGIRLESSSNNDILNNTILTDGGQDIDVDQTSYNNNISGNNPDTPADTTPPSVIIISPSDGGHIDPSSGSVTVEWTGSDEGSGIANFSIQLDGGSWISLSSDVTSYPFSSLSQGSHTVTVSATDGAGNSWSEEVTFVIDAVYDPSLPIRIDSDADLMAQAAAFGWTGDGSAANPYVISGQEFVGATYIGNTTYHVMIDDCTLNEAITIYNASNIAIEDSTIGGMARIYLTSSNNISITGNSIRNEANGADWSGAALVLVSSNGITISGNTIYGLFGVSLRSSSNNTILNNNISSVMRGIELESSSNNTISGNTVNTPSGAIGLFGSSNDNRILNNTLQPSESQNIDIDWSCINNTVSGNSGDVPVDVTAPWLTITSPSNGENIMTASTSVTWVGSDGWSGVASYAIQLDDGSWTTLDPSVSSYTFSELSEGAHTVTLSATDYAGNTRSVEVTFNINATYALSWPIIINSDADLVAQAAAFGWAGDGSAANPYVISGLNRLIHHGTEDTIVNCISISNTHLYLVIENCTLNEAISINSASNIVIQNNNIIGTARIYVAMSTNVAILNNSINDQAGSGAAVVLVSSSDIAISGNTIYGLFGVSLRSSSNNTISGNTISSVMRGIELESSSNDNYILNNVGYNSGNGNLYVDESCSNNTVSGNSWDTFVIDAVYDPSLPIRIDSDADLMAQAAAFGWVGDGSVENPYVISGLNLVGATYIGNTTYYVVIRDCVSDGGISVYNGSNIIIENNIVGGSAGIYLTSSSNVTISGNNVSSSWDGIGLYSSSGNTIWGNKIAGSDFGIILTSSSNDNVISGNNISSTVENIRLESSSNVTISGNTLISPENSIGSYSSNNNRILGNTFSGQGNIGVYLSGSSNNDVLNNSFEYNPDERLVYEDWSENNNISGNTVYMPISGQ